MVFGSDIENNATLYVPYGSIDLYKNADGWVGFTNILPIPGTEPQDEIVSGTCGINDDNLTWTLNITKGILSIEGSGDMQNFSAYAISPWSNYRNDVKELIIADGVTSIGNSAFVGFSNLTEITIPTSVTSIGDSPFASCSGVKEAIIVNDMFVKMPESYAGSYIIPDGITTIIAGACSDCSELTSVTLPEGLTTIGEEAFIRCSKLAEINIPTSVTTIGKNAFADCMALTTADIPESVTTIKRGTFAGSGITSVTLPSTITNIMMSAFSNCENLTTVTCWATEPPFTNGAFDGVPTDKGTLFVPYEALEAYKSAPEWMDWADIQAIPSTAIRDLRLSVPAIKTLNHGTIFITTHGKTYTTTGIEMK